MRCITAFLVWFFISMPAMATGIGTLLDEEVTDGLKSLKGWSRSGDDRITGRVIDGNAK